MAALLSSPSCHDSCMETRAGVWNWRRVLTSPCVVNTVAYQFAGTG